jgi:hypothetical protein
MEKHVVSRNVFINELMIKLIKEILMRAIKSVLLTKALLVMCVWMLSSIVQAAEEHQHPQHNHDSDHDAGQTGMSHSMDKMFLEKMEIDGYTVNFHVMEAQEGMRHGGSHNVMIKVEQNGKVLQDVVINSKVIFPDGKDQSKALMRMGEWYMNGYDLGQKGQYQLMILFKTADGKKHKGGVYYPEKY